MQMGPDLIDGKFLDVGSKQERILDINDPDSEA